MRVLKGLCSFVWLAACCLAHSCRSGSGGKARLTKGVAAMSKHHATRVRIALFPSAAGGRTLALASRTRMRGSPACIWGASALKFVRAYGLLAPCALLLPELSWWSERCLCQSLPAHVFREASTDKYACHSPRLQDSSFPVLVLPPIGGTHMSSTAGMIFDTK